MYTSVKAISKKKNKTNVTEFETGDSLVALAERCKLCLNCKRTSEKCHAVKDPSPNDSKRRLKHCDLQGCDEPGARSQRQQRKTAVAVSTLHEIILCGARIDNSDGGWIFAGHDEFSMAKLGGP